MVTSYVFLFVCTVVPSVSLTSRLALFSLAWTSLSSPEQHWTCCLPASASPALGSLVCAQLSCVYQQKQLCFCVLQKSFLLPRCRGPFWSQRTSPTITFLILWCHMASLFHQWSLCKGQQTIQLRQQTFRPAPDSTAAHLPTAQCQHCSESEMLKVWFIENNPDSHMFCLKRKPASML